LQQGGRLGSWQPVGGGQHAAVQVEADHSVHHLDRNREVRCGAAGQLGQQFVIPSGHSQQRPRRIVRGEQPAHHHRALGDHQTAATRPVRSAICPAQIAEVVQPRIVRIVDLDALAHRPALPRQVRWWTRG